MAFVGALVLVASLPRAASAHPTVRQGRDQLEQADFQGAILALQRAEEATDLTRDDVLELLEVRALAYLGLRDEAAVDRELVRIATLEPDHTFGRDAPPELAEAFQRILASQPGRLVVQADATTRAGRAEVRAHVEGDAGDLVRTVRVFGRTGNGGSWRSVEGRSLELVGPPGATASYYAEAIGPGGAVLASAGTGTDARTTVLPAAVAAGGSGGRVEAGDDDRGGGTSWVWIVGGGVAVVAVATVVTALLVSSAGDSSGTQPSGPTVEGF